MHAVFGKLRLYHSQLKQCILLEADWFHESKVSAGCSPPPFAGDWVFCEKEEVEENKKGNFSLKEGTEIEIKSISTFFSI